MAAYTFIFYTLLLLTDGFSRLVNIKSVIFKDTAFISHFDRCRLLSYQHPKNADGWTDRQTDRWLFSFYMHSRLHEVIGSDSVISILRGMVLRSSMQYVEFLL